MTDIVNLIVERVRHSCIDWRSTTRAISAFEREKSRADSEGSKAILSAAIRQLEQHREQFQRPAERNIE